ncbi:MAG TPA: MG2 domain-containing protein, partial [Pyrinomonadaceae bacterium]|nr:MG2 domain-containing protein [Pyrinomonadaceae bacterium]
AEETGNKNFIILASHRDNFAISDLESFYFFNWQPENTNVQGYIYTDRPIYRPNHKVFFKGILRALTEPSASNERYRAINSQTVNVTIRDSKDARVSEQELRLSQYGTFNGEFTLPEEAPLGNYRIVAETEEGSSTGTFDVAEYKKPEYKVNVTTPKRFASAGSKTKFDVDARYFFGAPVANAEVKYYVYRSRYYPYFGETEEQSDDEDEYSDYENYYDEMALDGEGTLDASGHLSVEFDIPESNENDVWDFQYRFEAQVTDSSRRSINASASLVATRGNVIAHAFPDAYVYNKDETAKISVETTDYHGRPVPAKVSLKFVLRTWVKVEKKINEYDPDYEMREEELGSGEVVTSNEGHAYFNFRVTKIGSIVIKTVVHESGKQYVSLGGFIWSTGNPHEWSDSCYFSENFGSIKLVPDKKSYRPGDTAKVLAILPEDGANLLLTTEREGVMAARYVNVAGKTAILDVPIEKNYAPNFFVSVTFVKNGDMYTSDQRLVVPARDKMLNLEVISNKNEYKPRETASYTILARDADGAPVPDAEVSLGVVDEAIYSLSPDYSGNIRQQFYGMRYNSVETHLSISYYFRGFAGEKPVDLASTKPSYQLADFKAEGEQVQPMIRKDFKDTAYWEPSAVTGKDGRATVKFRLPDNLTTWRATARGVTSDTLVGLSRHKVISRKDVILRLETPRFLTQGDTVTLSGIVHNYLKQDKSTQISISVAGAQLVGPAQQTVNIARHGEHRVDWKVSAPQTGQITLLAKALTDTESDAVELTLDVVPRGLHENKTERWTTTDDNAQQEFSLTLPGNSDLNSRRLRIEVAPSVAGTLFGALDYLTTYPYGCTEQTMSSFLPNIIVSQT